MRVGSGKSPLSCANTGANFGITKVDRNPAASAMVIITMMGYRTAPLTLSCIFCSCVRYSVRR